MKNYLKIAGIAGSILLSSNAAGSLLITEIMYNPSAVADPNGEWFEVYNYGSTFVDTYHWTISDAANNTYTFPSSLIINPGDYYVFGYDGNAATNGGISGVWPYSSNILLNNTSDSITIRDNNNDLIDEVVYDNGASSNFPFMLGGGASIELSLSAYHYEANNDGANWSAATTPYGLGDLGTPFNSPVPIPAAVWLFGSGLLGLAGVARKSKAA